MGTILRITSYLALGNSIFWAYFYTVCCIALRNGTLNGQGALAALGPFLIGTTTSIVCLLAFIIWACYVLRKQIKKRTQVLGIETRLVWGAILLLNTYYFPLFTGMCY